MFQYDFTCSGVKFMTIKTPHIKTSKHFVGSFSNIEFFNLVTNNSLTDIWKFLYWCLTSNDIEINGIPVGRLYRLTIFNSYSIALHFTIEPLPEYIKGFTDYTERQDI